MTRDSVDIRTRTYSLEEYERLPDQDGWRDELVRGRIAREPQPGAEHGWLSARLFRAIDRWAEDSGAGIALMETGFLLSVEPPTVRGPDVAFLAIDRVPEEGIPKGFWPLAPDLAVEVVSPSNTASGIQEKVLEYLAAGSRAVWVVDPKTRTVTVCRSPDELRILSRYDALETPDLLPGFRLPLAELFAPWRRRGR